MDQTTSSNIQRKADIGFTGAKPVKPIRIKRCPDCYSNIPMNDLQCPSCNLKIKKETDQHGYAKKPIKWSTYISCFLAWAGAAIYIWWAFFKD